jgi:hypothetical protein
MLSKMEIKGICLYKQVMNIENSSRTIVTIKAIEVKGEEGNNKGKTGPGRRKLDYNYTKPD